MNTPPDPGDSRWEDLLDRARKDRPAPVDLAALQRQVRHEARRLATARRAVAPDWTDAAALPFHHVLVPRGHVRLHAHRLVAGLAVVAGAAVGPIARCLQWR
jgi:hypothetical protein